VRLLYQKRPDKWSECSRSEESLRTDDAPQNAAVEMDSRNGTSEAVDGLRSADVGDICEHPVQDTNLREA
jgi:hypothetical protein